MNRPGRSGRCGTAGSFLILLLFAALGCQTTYGPAGIEGGYKEKWLGGDGYEIRMSKLDFDTDARLDAMLRRRAAELALEQGKRYFEVKAQQSRGGPPIGLPRWRKIQVELQDEPGPVSSDAVQVVLETDEIAHGRLSERARQQLEAFQSPPDSR